MISFDYDDISNHEDTTYVGDFVVDKDSDTFSYICPWKKPSGLIDRRLLKKLGDVVYFMYANKTLVKIGKAAGKGGMDARIRTYTPNKSAYNDRTNEMMLKELHNFGSDRLEIFAMQCPRKTVAFTNPLSETISYIEVETARAMESELTAEAMSQGHELLLCTQKT